MATTVEELLLKISVQGAAKAVADIGKVQTAWIGLVASMGAPIPTPKWPVMPNFKFPSGGGGGFRGGFLGSIVGTEVMQLGRAIERAFQMGVHAFKDAADYAREVLTIKELTGGTTQQAAGYANLFKTAGINDSQAVRIFTHLESAIRSARGMNAVERLGVHISQRDTGTEIAGKVLPALGRMADGVYKTNIQLDLFGQRLAGSAAGLQNLTPFQASASLSLGQNVKAGELTKITQAFASLTLLGETFMERVVIPFAAIFAPAVMQVADALTNTINLFANLNDSSNGLLGNIALWAGIGAVIATAFIGAAAAIGAMIPLLITAFNALKTIAIVQAVIDALTGNWQLIAAAAVIGIGVGIALNQLGKDDSTGKEIANNTGRAAEALDAIKVRLVGGGESGRMAASQTEAEIIWMNANRLGAG